MDEQEEEEEDEEEETLTSRWSGRGRKLLVGFFILGIFVFDRKGLSGAAAQVTLIQV